MAAVESKIIKNFFNKDELNLLQKYCYNRLDKNTDWRIDEQSFSPAWYSDPLMSAMLSTKLSKVEKESGLTLLPTYAYWRYYVFGGSLDKHIDRPACEISITVCIKKYDDWPIIIEDKSFELLEGEALLYPGHEVYHWRPGVYEGEGMAQLFMHYIDKNGPYTEHAYDHYELSQI